MLKPRRRSRQWSTELSEWKCYLCGRQAGDIGEHPLPIRQRAHLLPNRLTGTIPRYGGTKNHFRDDEWTAFLTELGPVLEAELCCTDVRTSATAHCYELCGECHEEILSEPIYLPSVMAVLQPRFRGASRVQKVAVLTRMLKLGAEALAREIDPTETTA